MILYLSLCHVLGYGHVGRGQCDVNQGTSSNSIIDICLDLTTRSEEKSFKSISTAYRRQRYQDWKSISVTSERGA